MSEKITLDGRKLLTIGQMPNFILIVSPIIITFLLFFLGGGPLNIVPGLIWFVSLFIIQGLVVLLKKMNPGKKLSRSNEEIRNAMNAVCGIFSTPFGENIDLQYMPSERVVFHFFTIMYLAIHLGFAKIPGDKIIMPVLFLSFIALIGIADVVRLKLAKCFSVKDVVSSVLFGLIGGVIAIATASINDNVIFFKNINPQCVIAKRCK
tara:strand:+ start:627 stop:1247 length:621 start_codon:yes stop_codon:yes gene_type:complete